MQIKPCLYGLIALLPISQGLAQEVNKTPQQIQAKLDQAQRDFDTAKEMFIPWYTGPLITGSADNVPAGKTNIQIYSYFINDYAQFNKHRKSVNIPNVYTINPLLLFQRGLTTWLDFTIIPQGFFRWSRGRSAQQFGDTATSFGFQLVKETPDLPSIRFVFGTIFPTGKYQRLNSKKNGIDATGSGAFQTVIGLNISRMFWKIKLHPMRLRLSTAFTFPDNRVKVHNFHAYGGGIGTRGEISLGESVSVDLGIEVSLTQKWVFATDVAFTHSNSSSFSGTLGRTKAGTPAANGAPSSDQLSLAPAIEYNINSSAGFIGGVWFTVTGRNSSNFIALVLSYTQLF